MANPDAIAITVAYAGAHDQAVLALNVMPGTTVRSAIERSRILSRFPEIDLARNKVGIHGQLRRLSDFVAAGDRIEIYRPLIADPKASRLQRSKAG